MEILKQHTDLINEQFHIILSYIIQNKFKLDFNLKENKNREELIQLLDIKNKDGNKILIKNLKEKDYIDFRTTIFLFFQIYFYNEDKEIKINEHGNKLKQNSNQFFKHFLSGLLDLHNLIKEYIMNKIDYDEIIERFFQNIYFVFKHLNKEFPNIIDQNIFHDINHSLKILMLKNSLDINKYSLNKIIQENKIRNYQ